MKTITNIISPALTAIVLACFALSLVAQAAPHPKSTPKGQKGPPGPAGPHHPPGGRPPVQHPKAPQPPPKGGGHPETPPGGSAAAKPAASAPPAPVYHYNFPTKSGLIGRDFTRPLTPEEQSSIARQIANGQPGGNKVPPGVAPTQTKVNPLRPQHFNLPSKPDPTIGGVKFAGTGHIPGSETWTDPKYAPFRNYQHEWHDKDWWEDHPKPIHCPDPELRRPIPPTPPPVIITLVYGGWYRWHAGYWYPAWGYDPAYSYYPYDGPIYSYGGLAPDQVVANVQAALQALGYYHGPINGLLEPATRTALADYQRDHGLYTTSAIDEATLAELGMS